MSTLNVNKVQVGQSPTAVNNTVLSSDAAGLKISNGNVGTEVLAASISKDGDISGRDISARVLNIAGIVNSGGAISGDRNRVINGSCQIVNVATFVAANNQSGFGGPEMFRAENAAAGGQFTQSQQSLSFGGLTLPTVRQTVNTANTNITAGNYWFGIHQFIEGFNVFDLRGKPVVISFVFNTNVSGTYSVALTDAAASGAGNGQSYVATFAAVANTPVQVTIPVAAIPAAASVPNTNGLGLQLSVGFLNTGVFQTATLNQWQSGNFRSATGATNWGATAGNFIELTNLQLEEGTVATPFIRRSYGVELALTQRYFEKSYSDGVNPGTANVGAGAIAFVAANNSTSEVGAFRFAVHKRAVPTITIYSSVTGAAGNIRNTTANADVVASAQGSSTTGFNGFGFNPVTGNGYLGHFAAIARL